MIRLIIKPKTPETQESTTQITQLKTQQVDHMITQQEARQVQHLHQVLIVKIR